MKRALELVRGELERLFTVEELVALAEGPLALGAFELRGEKASLARALVERCAREDRLDALADAMLQARRDVDTSLRDLDSVTDATEPRELGDFQIERRLQATAHGVLYRATRSGAAYDLHVLAARVARDRRSAHRWLTANRLLAGLGLEGVPAVEAREIEAGVFAVAWPHVEGESLERQLERVESRGQPIGFDVRLLHGILEPIAAMHRARLVHGSLHPRGVIVTPDGVRLVELAGDRLKPGGLAREYDDVLAVARIARALLAGAPRGAEVEAFLVRLETEDPKTRVADAGAALRELDALEKVPASERGAPISRAPDDLEELVERLLARSERALPGPERARVLAEIGHVYEEELDDADQALVAYTQALCQDPVRDERARDVERLCRGRREAWAEQLRTIAQAIEERTLAGSAAEIALMVRAARWYDEQLDRTDYALGAYREVLAREPTNERAAEGVAEIYRRTKQAPELVAVLLGWAEVTTSPPRARDLKAEAADVLDELGTAEARARAIVLLDDVLLRDPGHDRAADTRARIAERAGDGAALVALFERRAAVRSEPAVRANAFERAAAAQETRLGDEAAATRSFEKALALDPRSEAALAGLERLYAKSGRTKELVAILRQRRAAALTPRAKIELHERIAELLAVELVDHAGAAAELEAVLTLDPTNEHALTDLVRHHRALERWDAAAAILERHAAVLDDPARRVELLLARARLVAEHGDEPAKAIDAYEAVLTLAPTEARALDAIARLRETTGDTDAALAAIEALAAKATTRAEQAEQWLRAARILEARGDGHGAVERYRRALAANPDDEPLARARLWASRARLEDQLLGDGIAAEASAMQALALDPENADASLIAGDVAFVTGRLDEARVSYGRLMARIGALPRPDAVRVLVRWLEAAAQPPPEDPVRIDFAAGTLSNLVLQEPASLPAAAAAVFALGRHQASLRLHSELARRTDLSPALRARALYRLGESARVIGEHPRAIEALREALTLDPASAEASTSLAATYDATGDWDQALATRRARLAAPGLGEDERFELLLQVADVLFAHGDDRTAAAAAYAAAVEVRPDDRRLLGKLMQLYSETRDWEKLTSVVLRLADFVGDEKQRAKYMQTAATIAAEQLGDPDRALGYYLRAIESDPSLDEAIAAAIALHRKRGDHLEVERLLKLQLGTAREHHDVPAILRVLETLADHYEHTTNDPDLAVDALEAAQAFETTDGRAERLAALYAAHPEAYLERAIESHAALLRADPYRLDSYRALRRLYTTAKRADPSWCLCQALAILRAADEEERAFYVEHRAENVAPANASLEESGWTRIAHPRLDPMLTRIFALIEPTIVRARTERIDHDVTRALELGSDPDPVARTLYYAGGVLGVAPPPLLRGAEDAPALAIVRARTPAFTFGPAEAAALSNQELAFLVGRKLAWLKPGYWVRHLLPTGTGLKAWLFAAIKLSVPQFPIPTDLTGPVAEATAALAEDFTGPANATAKEKLASNVSKLLQTGGAIDLKRWVAAIDLTADRAGLLLAHDLQIATQGVRASEEEAVVPVKERMKELVVFAVSESYFALRARLGIGIDA